MTLRRVGSWLALGSALVAGPLAAGAQEQPSCQARLVPCNLGHHYSGTFRWTCVAKSDAGTTTEDVTVHVVRGKARCEGSVVSTDPSATTGAIGGDGLLVVESGTGTEEDSSRPWYRIAAACPGVDGSPAQIDGGEFNTFRQGRRGYDLLEGALDEEIPGDENGGGGSLRLRWKLTRVAATAD
jgi:hypothetical protein